MRQVRARRLVVSLLTSAVVLAWGSPTSAEVIFFTTGRTMSVKGYRLAGDQITVTLRHGGEATFDRALIARIAPSEIPDIDPAADPVAAGETVPGAARQDIASRPFAELIETVALRHGIDPALVHAVVEAESNYQPAARSHVGARGLMQVMPATGRELGVRRTSMLFDPRANLEAGVKYLKWLLERFDGDVTNALAAYNAGPAAVARYQGVPPYKETQDYVRKVLANVRQ